MRSLKSALIVLTLLAASPALAQERGGPASVAGEVARQVLLDPTTYIPAAVTWGATRLDWASSQPFFQNGYFEQNPNFTVSGRPNDTAIGYSAGNRQILIDAFANLQVSLVNNASTRLVEHWLVPKYPNHRTLVRTLGWVERSLVASYLSYKMSTGHLRQWRDNEQRARELGLR